MKLPTKLPDLLPGEFDGLVIGIVGMALAYVGSQGFSRQAWKDAAMTAGPPAAALMGFRKGYNTLNPSLHVDEIVKAAAVPAAQDLTGRLVDRAVDRLADVIDPRGIFTAQDPAPEHLPPGWSRDEHGHLRDDAGRYASEESLRDYRPG